MTPTRTALAALLHAALLTSSFLLLPSSAQAEVIPIIITNIVVQKIGPEAELEPLEEGLLYWRPADATTEAGLYYADGETPGGVAVCVGKADYHTLTNTLRCMGHAIELNAHYSLRAEGDSCLLRYGTNIVLRVDGNREAGSTNSLIKATILSADNDGLTIQANALASDGATIEVTTDLLAVEAWTTATNAAVIESTDVTTTWRITYLDEPYQFYRVFAGGSTPHGTGITAERPLTAAQGLAIPAGQPLTMGDTTWTNLPDMSIYASNSAVAAVRADLTSLSWRTTTAEGAIDANAAAIASNRTSISTNSNRLAAIEADYVQAADIADFATSGAVATVAARVDDLSSVVSSNSTALCVITNAFGQRISEFEIVNIGCAPTMQTNASSNVWLVPTNCPTRNLDINIDAMNYTSTNYPLTIRIPAGWTPSKPINIRFLINRASSSARINYYIGNSSRASNVNPTASQRQGEAHWIPECGAWRWHWIQLQSANAFYSTNGSMNASATGVLSTNIEEWVVWRNKQPW